MHGLSQLFSPLPGLLPLVMGACCSGDSLPDVPQVIIPDPDVNSTITAVTRRIGMFGRDFSVHKDAYPQDKEEIKEKMWMWLNKSDGGVIDLENFERGWNESNPNKGKVLYSAVVTERPHFEQFQRLAHSSIRDRFMGFNYGHSHSNYSGGSSGYDSDDDGYYIRHHNHANKFGHGRRYQVQF